MNTKWKCVPFLCTNAGKVTGIEAAEETGADATGVAIRKLKILVHWPRNWPSVDSTDE